MDESLLIVALVGILLLGLYAMWLHIKLWFWERSFGNLVIVTSREPGGPEQAGGCSLVFLVVVLLLVGMALFSWLSNL